MCLALDRKASPPSRPVGIWLSTIIFVAVLAPTYGFLGMVGAYQPELRDFPWPIGIGLAVIFAGIGWMYFLLVRFVWRQSRLKREERSRVYQFARVAAVIGTAIPFLIVQFCVTDVRFREVALNTLLKFPTSISSQTKIDYAAAEAGCQLAHRRFRRLGMVRAPRCILGRWVNLSLPVANRSGAGRSLLSKLGFDWLHRCALL